MTRYKQHRGETDKQFARRTALLKQQRRDRRRRRRRLAKSLKLILKRDAAMLKEKRAEKRKAARLKRLNARLWREAGRQH
jgi:hypothetical protein